MTNKKNNNSVTISLNVTPEVAEALDHMLWIDLETRAGYVRDLLIRDLQSFSLISLSTPTTPAQARARNLAVKRRNEA